MFFCFINFSFFSCTASSCDFWPHCGVTGGYTQKVTPTDVNHQPKGYVNDVVNEGWADCGGSSVVNEDDEVYDDDDDDDDNYSGGRGGAIDRISESVPNLSDNRFGAIVDSCNRSLGSVLSRNVVPYHRYRSPVDSFVAAGNRDIASDKKNVIQLLTNKPPIYEKIKSSSVLFLSEREMPITRKRESRQPARLLATTSKGWDGMKSEAGGCGIGVESGRAKGKLNMLRLPIGGDDKISTMPTDTKKIR